MINLADVNTKVAMEDIKARIKTVPDLSGNPLCNYVEYEQRALKCTAEMCPAVYIERAPLQRGKTPAVQMYHDNFWLTLNLYIIHHVPSPSKLTTDTQWELDAIMHQILLYLEKPEDNSEVGLIPSRTSDNLTIWSWWPQRRGEYNFEEVKTYPVNGVFLPVEETAPMFCRKVTLADIDVRFRN